MRMHLKRKRKHKSKLINKILIIAILIFICVILIFNKLNNKASKLFMEYSKIETKKIASMIITSTITEQVANDISMDDLFTTTKDSNNNIKNIDFKSSEANKLLVKASKKVEENLKYLEEGKIDKLSVNLDNYNIKNGVVFEVPSGLLFNNSILYNIFPHIPVKLELIGNTVCNLKTDIKNYGINNAFITVSIEVLVDIKIIMPFTSKVDNFKVDIPIIMKIIEGSVPSYYLNGYLDTITE